MKSNLELSCHANIKNVWKSDLYFNTDVKIGKDTVHGTGFKRELKTSLFIFSIICCWYTLELPHRGDSNVYLQYMSFK